MAVFGENTDYFVQQQEMMVRSSQKMWGYENKTRFTRSVFRLGQFSGWEEASPLTCPLPGGWHANWAGMGEHRQDSCRDTALLLPRLIHYSPDLKNRLRTNRTAVIKQQGVVTNYSWLGENKEKRKRQQNEREIITRDTSEAADGLETGWRPRPRVTGTALTRHKHKHRQDLQGGTRLRMHVGVLSLFLGLLIGVWRKENIYLIFVSALSLFIHAKVPGSHGSLWKRCLGEFWKCWDLDLNTMMSSLLLYLRSGRTHRLTNRPRGA